jgi:hypothetical protein
MINNNDKQRLLVEYLVSSTDTFALCKNITKPAYFDPDLRKAMIFIHEYYDKYHATPNPDQVKAETGAVLKTHHITRDQIEYCSTEVEKFCKRRAIQLAVIESPALILEEDYGKVEQLIKDAVSISLNRDMGIKYFDDPRTRLEDQSIEPPRTPTKWDHVDALLGGGLARTEMILVSANSGGGKSVTLANLAINFLEQKLNVLYLSLELSEKMVSQRFDSMFTGISARNWRENLGAISSNLEQMAPNSGQLTIKRMASGTNANAIRSYIKEFELLYNYVPDLLIVDYLDVMSPNEHVSADNISEKDKRSAEQLHDIGFEYNMFIASASQQNRGAIDAQELNQGHIAGGLTKINTVDVYISIILTPTMRAAGEIGFAFLKTRSSDGVGKTVYLKWNPISLRISNLDHEDDNSDKEMIARVAQLRLESKTPKKGLNDIFDI